MLQSDKRARIPAEREPEAQALLQSEVPGLHSESEEASDSEVSDSENESDVEFNQSCLDLCRIQGPDIVLQIYRWHDR